jgi:tetratricopeptide (TPR) repeat protein
MPVKVALILALLVTLALTVSAQSSPARNLEKEKAIWDQLQSIAPGAVEDFKAGTVAMDSNNYEEAIKRYQSALEKAPEFDHVLRRLGFSLAYAGRVDEGLKLIETALKINRSPENLMGLARTLAYPNETKEGSEADKMRALALAKEADRRPETQGDSDYKVTVAQLALDTNQTADFRAATEQLVARHPELMVTHYFNAILAPSTKIGSQPKTRSRKPRAWACLMKLCKDFSTQEFTRAQPSGIT